MVGNLFLYALTDADPLLADFKRDESGATDVSGSQIHQDGIDHIKAHAGASDLSSSQVPGQQGSEATSGGLPSGAGGVSSTAYTGSPVTTEEQKPGVVDQTVETVRNYLGSLGFGGESNQESVGTAATEDRHAGREASGGVVAGTAAAVSAATAAVVSSSSDSSDKKQTTSGGTWLNYSPGQSRTEEPPAADYIPVPVASDSREAATSTSAVAGSREGAMADASAQRDESNVTSGTPDPGVDDSMSSGQTSKPAAVPDASKDDSLPSSEQGAKSGETNESVKEEAKEAKEGDSENKSAGKSGAAGSMENRDAIPTAGGEKLGEKHWGESKIVPEVPPKTEGVSSADGQSDGMFKLACKVERTCANCFQQRLPRTTRRRTLEMRQARATVMTSRVPWRRLRRSSIWAARRSDLFAL